MKLARIGLILLMTTLLAQAAHAHRFAPSLLKLTQIASQQYSVVWKTPATATSSIPLIPVWPATCEVLEASPVQQEGTGKVATWTLLCPSEVQGLIGETLAVTGLVENQASALFMLDLLDGRHYQQVLTGTDPQFVIPVDPGSAEVMKNYTVLGIEHIWGGIDHLLFVLGLLLLVGGGSRLLWTITAFTAGHSITLSLVTLGYFNYPVALVEFTIALSIFVLAVELTRRNKNDLVHRHPWWLAAGFGLLHGMGFAGALAETGLPQDNIPLALLFFNVGIEIGQIAFIVGALGIWWWLKRWVGQWQVQLRPIPIYILGSLSVMWCIERGLEALA
jgi:hypothetical protein